MKRISKRELNALLRTNFEAFVEKVFRHLLPGDRYIPSWHIQAMAYALTRVARGDCLRLALNLPPRHLKSICASVALPAWLLGRDPSCSIICASYSEDLAAKHSRDCREIMQSAWYQEVFPGTRLSRKKMTETEFTTTKNGFRLTTSIGGTLTGRGADYLIIDDPLKAGDANSANARNAANEWYDSTALNRLNDKKNGRVVVAAHRLHEDDLTGHVTGRTAFETLSLPAIAEEDSDIPIGPNEFHHRRAGDVLSPDREDRDTLEAIKREMGSTAFSAQYQQTPVPAGGNVIQAVWLKTYKHLPKSDLRIIHSWDIAMTASETADWTVGTIWGMDGDLLYLLDVKRGRWQTPDVKRNILAAAEIQRPEAILIEDAMIGTSLLQELRHDQGGGFGLNFIGCKPEKDKLTRATAMQTTFEAGRVLFPEEAHWLGDYKRELLGFPNGRHDDQVDSTSQFINWVMRHRNHIVAFVLPDLSEPSKWDIGPVSIFDRPSWWGRDLQR